MADTSWTPEALAAEIGAFLAAHHTMTLATVSDAGMAHAASLLYAADGFALVWTSDPKSRHSLHLAARTHVAATIAPDHADFAVIRGLQVEGTAARLEGADEAERARELLEARYPFLSQLGAAPPKLREAWRNASFYRLTPSRITLIDNTRGFGHKATLAIDGDRLTLA